MHLDLSFLRESSLRLTRMSENTHNKEKWQLLQNLRSTVEGLLIDGVSNVWDVYGGLNRLHNVMDQIFKHGCRIFDPNVSFLCRS